MKFSYPARALALLAGSLAGPLCAQESLLFVEGDAAGDRFGYSLTATGDVDGDGIPDWAVGAPFRDAPRGDTGQVRVHSGADGSLLLLLAGESPGDHFGTAVAGLGDVNGDGRADIAVGAHSRDLGAQHDVGVVRVHSGADGSELYRVSGSFEGDQLGFSLAAAGDVDGDGVGDLIVGVRGDDTKGPNAGAALVLSGLNGSLIHRLVGASAHDLFGSAVTGLGDLDGDGRPEVAVGARWNDVGGENAGSVSVFRGSDGSFLTTLYGLGAGEQFGSALANAGDLDGDGLDELLVGSPGSDLFGSNAGCVQAFSGATGQELFRWLGDASGDALGISIAGGRDFDGDGTPDVLAGAVGSDVGGSGSGAVHVLSGATGARITTIVGTSPGARLGFAVAALDDLTSDGKSEVLVGAYGDANKGSLTGRADVVTLECLAPTTYCIGAPNGAGTSARIGLDGAVSVSTNDFELTVEGARPNQFGVFYYGTAQTQVPFGNGFRCVAGEIYRMPALQTDGSGAASYQLNLATPPDPESAIAPGDVLHFQFWYRDPGGPQGAGANLSDAMSVRFCP